MSGKREFASAAKEGVKALVAREIAGGDDWKSNSLKVATGHVQNPFSYAVFGGVQHRNFTFTWNLMPLSHRDQNILYDIIDTFQIQHVTK